ncbi:hypothetical protein L3Q82_001959 [Scortum barcoo]|uniref:Uncharacterized protein n=2 Tax=Scortum barcoo TaxID=214431 RepID=A0ACB8W247_9TELE|nr:hypothetical protein L3Q82_001960 [Scortum barcoo]KAI3361750.1 hypothetical protein L3Q82_001959 [Scortum barcoo]
MSSESEGSLDSDFTEGANSGWVTYLKDFSPEDNTGITPYPKKQGPDSVTVIDDFALEDDAGIAPYPEVQEPYQVTNIKEFHSDDAGITSDAEKLEPDCVTYIEKFYSEAAEVIVSDQKKTRQVLPGGQSVKGSVSPVNEPPEQGKDVRVFLAVLIGKLLDHIADSTTTSIFDVDFNWILEQRFDEVSNVPQTVGNLHIRIYNELRRTFGSAKLIQAAMVSKHEMFADIAVRILKAQLHHSSRTSGFITRAKRFIGRKKKRVAPACEKTTACHTEVINPENPSMPPPERKKKQPAIIKMFFSTARTLKKLFNFCIKNE